MAANSRELWLELEAMEYTTGEAKGVAGKEKTREERM